MKEAKLTRLYPVEPDLTYFNDYNDMMREWCDSNTQIAPWFLDKPIPTTEEFAQFVKHLDDCSYGRLDPRFCSTTSYFVVDENDRLAGAASLRHCMTVEGMNTWGIAVTASALPSEEKAPPLRC